MTEASTPRDDLTILQRDVAELQESRSQTESADAQESGPTNNIDPATETVGEAASPEETGNAGNAVQDIADQFENYLKDIEEIALERPTLALLATFALGVVVGHYISRR